MFTSFEDALRSMLTGIFVEVAREVFPRSVQIGQQGNTGGDNRKNLVAPAGTPADGVPDLALSLDEAAAAIRMSTDWLRKECRHGRFPHVRLGRRLLFRPLAINAWLTRRETNADGP